MDRQSRAHVKRAGPPRRTEASAAYREDRLGDPRTGSGPGTGQAVVAAMLQLQRLAGNQAVSRAIQRKQGEATESVLTHIFKGEVKKDGRGRVEKVVGYHSEAEKDTALVEVPANRTEIGGYAGIYHAEPVRDKVTRTEKDGGSTFYPTTWDRGAVTLAIERSQAFTGDPAANRKVSGKGLPGLDDTVQVLLKVAGDTIYPIRTRKRPKKGTSKT